MKKIYVKPAVEMVQAFTEPILGVNSERVEGKLPDGTNIGDGGDSNPDDTPGAKPHNVWNTWDD